MLRILLLYYLYKEIRIINNYEIMNLYLFIFLNLFEFK